MEKCAGTELETPQPSRNSSCSLYFLCFILFTISIHLGDFSGIIKISNSFFNHFISYILAKFFISTCYTVPGAITSSKPMPVLLGDYLILTCAISNFEDSTSAPINWFHNDIIQPGVTTDTYILSGVQIDDLGFYKCANAANTVQTETFNIYTEDKYGRYLKTTSC